MKTLIVALLALIAAGCTQLPGKNLQGHAGITDVRLDWTAVDGKPVLSGARWVDGKEKQDVTLEADIAKGTVTYSATGVKAFTAFEVRAEVEKVLIETQGKAVSEILPKVVDAVIKAIGIP